MVQSDEDDRKQTTPAEPGEVLLLAADALQTLIDGLRRRGFRVIGPTIDQQAVVLEEIDSVAQLPAGWRDRQDGGAYRLVPSDDGAFFGHSIGPQSWKKYLHPARRRLWRLRRDGSEHALVQEEEVPRPFAFLGVRSCDLAAIAVQDRTFLEDRVVNPSYQDRRRGAFIVAVNCGRAGGTCFCVSMGTGPKAEAGYDLALTELIDAERATRLKGRSFSELGLETPEMHVEIDDDGNLVADHAETPTAAVTEAVEELKMQSSAYGADRDEVAVAAAAVSDLSEQEARSLVEDMIEAGTLNEVGDGRLTA